MSVRTIERLLAGEVKNPHASTLDRITEALHLDRRQLQIDFATAARYAAADDDQHASTLVRITEALHQPSAVVPPGRGGDLQPVAAAPRRNDRASTYRRVLAVIPPESPVNIHQVANLITDDIMRARARAATWGRA